MTRQGRFLLLFIACVSSNASGEEVCHSVPVYGRGINVCVDGKGPVTVVLAAGAGQTSETFSNLAPALSKTARVVTFDRPGLGRSEPGSEPRTPVRIAGELYELLTKLGTDGPLILVGHSMGGIHVLRYASLYPEHVRGVVILDTPPAMFEEARQNLLTPDERVERERLLAEGASRGRPVVRRERQGAESAAEWDFADFPRTVPLIVVVANAQDFGELGSTTAHRALWMAKSRQWLELADDAELLIAEGSGHMIHHERPELVVDAVRRLLNRTRQE